MMMAPAPRFNNDDDAAQHWLMVLRDGDAAQKIQAREQLAAIFEGRGMFEEATDLLVSNVQDGIRNADVFRWLARLYRAQGDEVTAMQAAAEAAKYMPPSVTAPEPAPVSRPMPQTLPAMPVAARPEHFPTDQTDASEDPLSEVLPRYLAAGYRIVSRAPNSIQLIKPKEFSAAWSILWFLACGVGVLVYVFYYMGKKDSTVYLTLNADGTVRAQSNDFSAPRPVAVDRWVCSTCGYANHDSRQVCKRTSCRAPRR